MNKTPLRCFLAVELDDPIQTLIRDIQIELKKAEADVKWVKPEKTHLTLKFLGDVDGDILDAIRQKLDQIAGRTSPFSLETTGLGAFPRIENPRIIWLGCADVSKKLSLLIQDIEERFETLGFTREKKEFAAHITLGRIRSGRNTSALIHALTKFPPPPTQTQCADHLTLFRSSLTAGGPIYESLGAFPFRARP